MSIRVLPQNLINQIAAGEVIERPASVIKELVENAIDAGADEIEVKIIEGGKSFISVSDNGSGMDKEALQMCVLTHATSKLPSNDLFNIPTFGFRGEAIPSIASISRLTIASATEDTKEAWKLEMESSEILALKPINKKRGTEFIVNDLFFATPARLKFLKTNATETDCCLNVINKIALAFKNITFRVFDSEKLKINYPKTDDIRVRVADVLGKESAENMFEIDARKDDAHLFGFISPPTFNKSSSNYQYFFVNNRPVKDSIFSAALRSAYLGLLPPGRHTPAVLFLDIPYTEVDVNAHPAKIEVRFKNSEKVRYLLFSSIKQSLKNVAQQAATVELEEIADKKVIELGGLPRSITSGNSPSSSSNFFGASKQDDFNKIALFMGTPQDNFEKSQNFRGADFQKFHPPLGAPNSSFSHAEASQEPSFSNSSHAEALQNASFSDVGAVRNSHSSESVPAENLSSEEFWLGHPLAQIANTYIIAQSGDEVIIIDQHAAAERITLEKLKKDIRLDSQVLLIPEVCALSPSKVEVMEKNKVFLNSFGIHFEKFSDDLLSVNSIPALFAPSSIKALISDIADDFISFDDATTLEEKVHAIFATRSCHNSLRAGKKLTFDEMNSLIRQMEACSNIAQCCHGRPSYIKITLADLNKFFERS